jgi:hypothetical protein
MKILDIRKTQSRGWVADVLWSENSILPISIALDELTDASLSEYQERMDMEALNEVHTDTGPKVASFLPRVVTWQTAMEQRDRDFNRRYYNNPDGKPEWKYK